MRNTKKSKTFICYFVLLFIFLQLIAISGIVQAVDIAGGLDDFVRGITPPANDPNGGVPPPDNSPIDPATPPPPADTSHDTVPDSTNPTDTTPSSDQPSTSSSTAARYESAINTVANQDQTQVTAQISSTVSGDTLSVAVTTSKPAEVTVLGQTYTVDTSQVLTIPTPSASVTPLTHILVYVTPVNGETFAKYVPIQAAMSKSVQLTDLRSQCTPILQVLKFLQNS